MRTLLLALISTAAASCCLFATTADVAAGPAPCRTAPLAAGANPFDSCPRAISSRHLRRLRKRAIRGTVNRQGYTVLLAALGARVAAPSSPLRFNSARARPSFEVTPPGDVVTVSLRDPSGTYAGPVVMGGGPTRAILGVRPGTRLGRIVVHRGYATLARRLPRSALVPSVSARARRGVPIGVGRFGRVASRARGRTGAATDVDRDGVLGAFDVDDDGDLVLDNVDRRARAAALPGSDPFHALWLLNVGLETSYLADRMGFAPGVAGYALNRNAAPKSLGFEEYVTLGMRTRGLLLFPIPPGDEVELDCGGLEYCRAGGGGSDIGGVRRFPGAFDADGDGFGTMEPVRRFNPDREGIGTTQLVDPDKVFALKPGASPEAIGSGDTYIERVTTDGHETQQPVTLGYVFQTVPALVAWSDGTRSARIEYPVPPGGQGGQSNPISVKPSADGHYRLTLTVWRPQRPPLAGEGGEWIDVGRLSYNVVGRTVISPESKTVWRCNPDAYSAGSGNTVTTEGVRDSAVDRPADPANTLTFTVDVSACLRDSGLPDWDDGSVGSEIFVSATSAFGDSTEGAGFAFTPQGSRPPTDAFSGTWRFAGGAPGTEIEWTGMANSTDEASKVGVIVYGSYHIVSGTPPPGWTCAVGRLSYDGDVYECTGNVLRSGSPVSGKIVLDSPGINNQPMNLLACTPGCRGYGIVQQAR